MCVGPVDALHLLDNYWFVVLLPCSYGCHVKHPVAGGAGAPEQQQQYSPAGEAGCSQ